MKKEMTVNELVKKLYAGETVRIPKVGTVKFKLSPAKEVRNPKTGELISVPERFAPKFKFVPAFRTFVRNLPVNK
jgi:nucleoid DNA-binding protein